MATRDLTLVLRARDQASKELTSMGQKLGGMAKAAGLAAAAGGAALAGFGAASVKAAADFETGMREVNTLINLSEKEFKDLSAQVVDVSKRMGVDAVGASKALYQAISAGVPKDNALNFLEIASKAAIGGVTDTTTAIDGLTTVLNAFKMPASEATAVADIMFTTVKLGKTTMGELSASMFNVAPIAAAAGVKFDEVSAAIASLTKQGTPTSVATTQIRAAIQAIIKPTEEMGVALRTVVPDLIKSGELSGKAAEEYQELGKQIAQLNPKSKTYEKDLKELVKAQTQVAMSFGPAILQSRGLAGTLELLNKTAEGNSNTLGKMYGSVEGLQAVLGITGANAQMFAGDLEAVRNATGASQTAFEQMNKSAGRQWAQLQAAFQSVMITIGSELLPALTPLLTAIAQGLPGAIDLARPVIEGLTRAIADGAAIVLPYVQALNPALFDALGNVGQAIGNVTGFFRENKLAMAGLITVVTAMTTAFALFAGAALAKAIATGVATTAITAYTAAQWLLNAALTANPIGIIIVALAGLAAGLVYAYQNSEDFRRIVDAAFKAVQGAFNAMWNAAKAVVDWLGKAIPDAGQAIDKAMQAVSRTITDTWNGIKSFLSGILNAIGKAITDVWNQIPEDIRADLGLIASHLSAKFNEFITNIQTWLGQIWRDVQTAFENIKTTISTVLTAVRDSVIGPILSGAGGVLAIFGDAWASMQREVTSAFEGVRDKIGELLGPEGALGKVIQFSGDLLGKLGELVTAALAEAKKIGDAIIQGIWQGIQAGWQWLMDRVGDLARAALAAAKKALGISSPSAAFMEVGRAIVDGIVAGIAAAKPALQAAMTGLAEVPAAMTVLPDIQRGALSLAGARAEARVGAWAKGIGLPAWLGRLFAGEHGGNLPASIEQLNEWLNKKGWRNAEGKLTLPGTPPPEALAGLSANLEDLRGAAQDASGALQKTVSAFSGAMDRVVGAMDVGRLSSAARAAGNLGKAVEKFFGNFMGPDPLALAAFAQAQEKLEQMAEKAQVVEQIKALASGFEELGQNLPPDLADAIMGLGQSLGGPFADMVKKYMEMAPQRAALAQLRGFIEEFQLGQQLAEAVAGMKAAGLAVPKSLLEMLAKVPRTPGSLLDEIIKQILATTPSFQHGTAFVPQTGLAILHRGEAVVPASRGNHAGEVHHHWHLTINSQADVEQVRDSYALMRSLAGI